MKKHFFLFLTIFAALFAACGDDDNNDGVRKIEIEQNQQLIQNVYADTYNGTPVTFWTSDTWTSEIAEVTADGTIKGIPDWISITPDKATKSGKHTIAIYLNTNYTETKRYASITIYCKGASITISITQDRVTKEGKVPEAKAIAFFPNQELTQHLYANAREGTPILFTTNRTWTSSIVEIQDDETEKANPDWISITPDEGIANDNKIEINLKINYSGKKRSALINIHCGGETGTINITQDGLTEDGKVPDVDVLFILPDIGRMGQR
ncbi:MAG: BACON domain-containing protein [Prevotella sp.]|nr:BACON domain-containing protein [Prevotella sp.]